MGPPEHLQWVVGPAYTRHHEHTTSITTIVSSGGRIFYIQDESPNVSILMPPEWNLVARDAFNGVLLWKQPIDNWVPPLTGFRHNPPSAQRTLVAIDDHVYTTLGFGQPIRVIDAATGATRRTLPGTEGAEEILCADNRVIAVLDPDPDDQQQRRDDKSSGVASRRGLAVLNPHTGELIWRKVDTDTATLEPLTLAVCGESMYFLNEKSAICLDTGSGYVRWRTPREPRTIRKASVQPTLVADAQVVLVAENTARSREHPNGELVALSAVSGERLWSTQCGEGYVEPPDVFIADGLVWVGTDRRVGSKNTTKEFSEGRDLLSGKIVRRLDTTRAFIDRPHHHRCYRNKATDRFLFIGRHGIEMIPLDGAEVRLHDWLRGACRYGIMPCNGLLYVPPHACSCHISQLLGHFRAVSGRSATPLEATEPSGRKNALVRGPAYERMDTIPSSADEHPPTAWPMYRHDPTRSGSTHIIVSAGIVSTGIQCTWTTRFGGRPTAPTIADGRVFVAVPDCHTIHAIDATSGEPCWVFTAGARVDTPPTWCRGRVVFGSADGWVYCLRTTDGEIIWKHQAAPHDRRLVAHGRVESVWPVHGSVLVRDGKVYASAGRSVHLDGGLHVLQLDLESGQVLARNRLADPFNGVAKGTQQGPTDLLSADDRSLYMRFQRWELETLKPFSDKADRDGEATRLICPTGMLDDSWFHRSHWTFGTSGVYGDPRTIGTRAPAGNLLVFDDTVLCGYGRKPGYFMWTTPVEFRLFAADRPIEMVPLEFQDRQPPQAYLWHPERQVAIRWEREIPLHARAMVLADDTLFVAGPPRIAKEGPPETFMTESRLATDDAQRALDAWQGRSGAAIWAVSGKDGSKLMEIPLDAAPVWDGMAAVSGMLLVACENNSLACFVSRD